VRLSEKEAITIATEYAKQLHGKPKVK